MERKINDAEAAVVQRIFELCAAGKGIRAIAKTLNAARLPAPRPQQGRPQAWAPTSVRDAMHRPLYRGVIAWNRSRKRDPWGQTKQRQRPECDWIEVAAPELRIVSEQAWQAAHARLDEGRQGYLRSTKGQLWGRPTNGLESKYLLTGLARCASCGGTLTVRSRNHGSKRAFFYACSSFHHRGRTVCPNSLEMRQPDADGAVLAALERELLDPGIIEEAMSVAISGYAAGDHYLDARIAATGAAITQVGAELERLTAAVLAGGTRLRSSTRCASGRRGSMPFGAN